MQDYTAFDLDLVRVEHRVQHDIGNHIQRQWYVRFQNPRVVGRDLAAGIGVDIAADIFNGFGNLQRAAAARTLEGHMLQKMGDPILV